VKCCRDLYFFRNQFSRLLRGGTLPDSKSARGAAAHSGGERDRGVDQNAAGANHRLELFEQSGLAFEGYGEHQ
jgi:hypothetical protein